MPNPGSNHTRNTTKYLISLFKEDKIKNKYNFALTHRQSKHCTQSNDDSDGHFGSDKASYSSFLVADFSTQIVELTARLDPSGGLVTVDRTFRSCDRNPQATAA